MREPRAIIMGVSEEDFEDYLLEHSPAFLKVLEKAREECLKTGGTSLGKYMKSRKIKAKTIAQAPGG